MQTLAAIDPTVINIKKEILINIDDNYDKVSEFKNKVFELKNQADFYKDKFLNSVFDFVSNEGSNSFLYKEWVE